MTEQQERELDSWMARAYEAEKRAWKAEKRLAAWMEHWNATARTGAVDEVAAVLDANARADQAEARIMHLEATAQVLVKEALDGLADDFDMWHQDMHTDEVARRIRHEMKLLYPKETP